MTTLASAPGTRSVGLDVARFEDMCAEKGLLEANIEAAIGKIDQLARDNVVLADNHLWRTAFEGASFIARLERACKGDPCEEGNTAKVHETNLNATPANASTPIHGTALALSNPHSTISPINAESFLSPPSVLSDFDALSDISYPGQAPPAGIDPMVSNSLARVELSNHLATLIQDRRALHRNLKELEGNIRNEVEKAEESALERVVDAKGCLEISRKEAIKILAELREEGSDICRQMAWTRENQHIPVTPVVESMAATILANEASVTPPIGDMPAAIDVVDIATDSSLLAHPLFHDTDFWAAHTDHSVTARSGAASPSIVTSRASPEDLDDNLEASHTTTYLLQDIFHRYEEMINEVKGKTASTLLIPNIPWPVLPPPFENFPVDLFNPLLAADTQRESLDTFITSYAEWKGESQCKTVFQMQADWTLVARNIAERKRGGKSAAGRVVDNLTFLCVRYGMESAMATLFR